MTDDIRYPVGPCAWPAEVSAEERLRHIHVISEMPAKLREAISHDTPSRSIPPTPLRSTPCWCASLRSPRAASANTICTHHPDQAAYSDFSIFARARTLDRATQIDAEFAQAVRDLFRRNWTKQPIRPARRRRTKAQERRFFTGSVRSPKVPQSKQPSVEWPPIRWWSHQEHEHLPDKYPPGPASRQC
jgi:hypothetical protein